MSMRLNYNKVAPEGMKALGNIHSYIHSTGLPATLVELVYLRISLINGCAYCIDLHTSSLQKSGLSSAKIALVPVYHEAESLFTDRERAALRWAETVTNVSTTYVPDAEFEHAQKYFSEKELADLTIAIGLMNTYNRMAISFRAVPDSARQSLAA